VSQTSYLQLGFHMIKCHYKKKYDLNKIINASKNRYDTTHAFNTTLFIIWLVSKLVTLTHRPTYSSRPQITNRSNLVQPLPMATASLIPVITATTASDTADPWLIPTACIHVHLSFTWPTQIYVACSSPIYSATSITLASGSSANM
jgi:hypothetical protein